MRIPPQRPPLASGTTQCRMARMRRRAGSSMKYVGTWIDSMHSQILHYEGTVDTAGKSLTLLTDAPNPAAPGKRCKFKEVIEVKGKDHKVLTTTMQGDDGKWVTVVSVDLRRVK